MFRKASRVPQWIVDLDERRMLDANEAALEFWRLTHEEFLARPVQEFLHPSELARWKKYIATGKWGESGPWKCVRGDGSLFYCFARWQMVEYRGTYCGFV